MKSTRIFQFIWLLASAIQMILLQSCKKEETQNEPLFMAVNLSRSVMHNDSYYSLNWQERSVELDFSQEIDSLTIKGNISFSDKNGPLDPMIQTISYGRKIIIAFQPGFQLNHGWKYLIIIKTGLKSTSGLSLQSNTVIEVRTTAQNLILGNDNPTRNSMVCISDIHMGDQRAATLKYGWFTKNEAALDSLLSMVMSSSSVRQLVILGDLFDEWVIPYRISPFDSLAGITDSRDYFLSIANSDINRDVVSKLRSIAAGGVIQLIYVPGNHDMLLTEEVLQEIIPGIIWQGDSPGLGHYSPTDEIIMEHGHRYDFFNCPQSGAVPGHILPPGYFISRLDAEGLMEQGSDKLKSTKEGTGQVEFLTAWTAAVEYLKIHYSLTVAADSANIRMEGIDGYASQMSYNGVRDMYAGNIENVWPATQVDNGVAVNMPVLMAILDGSMDLSFTAGYEFMQSLAPKQYKIVAFGHTHNPMLKVYPAGKNYTGIYANTGSWVNAELSNKQVRTFLVIKPAAWTGSELDVVSLYQYNLDSSSGEPNPGFIPVLISEESIGL